MEQDFIRELGLLSVVTRLKRISDEMIHDGRRMYRELGMDIEPNWFVIFKILEKNEEMTVTEIAEGIGFAHPSVISIVNKMIKVNYLEERKCGVDNRTRLLRLTSRAKEKMPEFERVWAAGVAGVEKIVSDLDILSVLDTLEERVFEEGFRQRALTELARQKEIRVVKFDQSYAGDFARLNYEWIEEFFAIEQQDREMLDNPNDYIISRGGQIFVALVGNQAVGTVALLETGEDSFELAKMAVTCRFRGLKIGDKLLSQSLGYAKNKGKKRVFLLSNRKLIPALTLYKKYGFKEIPLDLNTLYQRTNIQLEIIFNK